MRRKVKLGFCDFWASFDPEHNFLTNLLRRRFDIEIVADPEYMIFSAFGKEHMRFSGIRIRYSGENKRANFFQCDCSFDFDYVDRPEHCRLPYYVLAVQPEQLLIPPKSAEQILSEKTGFCTFVYSNPKGRERHRFFRKLSRYKEVSSGGRHWNNVGGPVADKLAFLRTHKFSFAFENGAYPGYTTEKLPESVIAQTLPIYWGNPVVAREFNPARFLNHPDYGSDEALIERIIELDQDDDQYLDVMRQPFFHGNRPSEAFDQERLLDQFERIFSTDKRPVGSSRACYVAGQAVRFGRHARRALHLD